MTAAAAIRTVEPMKTTPVLRGAGLAVLTSLTALVLPASPAGATTNPRPVTGLVSVSPTGATGTAPSTASDVSGLGRLVAFRSGAGNLVAGDTNSTDDVFVRNTLSATTTRVSVSTAGTQANGASDQPSISYDGRYVAFRSVATNLVAGDTNGKADIFLRDLSKKTTIRVSVKNSGGGQTTGGAAAHPQVSDDGNEVVFDSAATNVVDFDLNGKPDVFVRNISGGTTEIETLTSADFALTAGGTEPRFSGNGRYVVFGSDTNQVGVDTNNKGDIFLRDRVNGTTEKVSTASNGDQSDGSSQFADVSDNGRYVTFQSLATDLTPAVDAVNDVDVFRRDRTLATTELVTKNTAGQPANTGGGGTQVSADGNKVAFSSDATNLVTGDTNNVGDAFVRNMSAATTTRVSVKTAGGQANGLSFAPAISPDGSATSFSTLATDLYSQDANNTFDVFVRSVIELGPFADTLPLLQRQALDFTGTNLGSAAVIALNEKILSGVASPESAIDDFVHGTFDNSRGPVMRLYWAFFHRMPDLNGLNYWVSKYDGGMTLKTIANSFAKSSEFKTKYGSVSNDSFITLVYQNVLERNPDAAGKTHWVGRLKAGVTRGEMMTAFSESSEGIRKMRGEIDTILVFLGMLHRLPTPGEFSGYVSALETPPVLDTEVLINQVLTSSPYATVVST
jgi:Tol biopolymer transport system component